MLLANFNNVDSDVNTMKRNFRNAKNSSSDLVALCFAHTNVMLIFYLSIEFLQNFDQI